MDTRRIRKLIELVKETGVGELEVKSGEDSVRISTYAPGVQTAPSTPIHTATPINAAPATQPQPNTPKEESHTDTGYTQKAPMVGTVYLASTPGSRPFVAVGDTVKAGDPLCLIEAMKMFNKIEAECDGVISARLIENEQPVEFDQPLFIIEPHE